MKLRLLCFAPLALLLLVSSPARAQDMFAPSGAAEEEATPVPAPAPAPAPAVASDEWWRKQPVPLGPTRPPKPLALRFDGAYATRRLFALDVKGADMGLALGAQTSHHAAWWVASRLTLGSTENGLSVWSGRLGPEVEAVIDPVRLGIGASLLMIGVTRAVREETLLSFGIEARAFGRVDVVRNDDYALFLRAGIDAGAEAAGKSTFWGPAIGLGVELGVRGKRPEAWTAASAPPSSM